MKTTIQKLTSARYTLACLAAFAATAVATTSFAASPSDEAPSVRVRYDDLNLATESGTTALYKRIANAARQVCGDPDTRDLAGLAASGKCQAAAIAKAVSDVNSPKLAAMHAAHVSRG